MEKSQPSTLDKGVTTPGWLNPGYRAAWVVMKVDFQETIFTCAGPARFAGILTHYREAVEQTRGRLISFKANWQAQHQGYWWRHD